MKKVYNLKILFFILCFLLWNMDYVNATFINLEENQNYVDYKYNPTDATFFKLNNLKKASIDLYNVNTTNSNDTFFHLSIHEDSEIDIKYMVAASNKSGFYLMTDNRDANGNTVTYARSINTNGLFVYTSEIINPGNDKRVIFNIDDFYAPNAEFRIYYRYMNSFSDFIGDTWNFRSFLMKAEYSNANPRITFDISHFNIVGGKMELIFRNAGGSFAETAHMDFVNETNFLLQGAIPDNWDGISKPTNDNFVSSIPMRVNINDNSTFTLKSYLEVRELQTNHLSEANKNSSLIIDGGYLKVVGVNSINSVNNLILNNGKIQGSNFSLYGDLTMSGNSQIDVSF